ncbi:hypothetical protein FRC17_010773 [Serendipita sp. 399]|nr:hypothetical protein FRC17_010773 [Serendipita sp. 399]
MEYLCHSGVASTLFGDGTLPEMSQYDHGRASPDTDSQVQMKKWSIEDSMYIKVLKSMSTIAETLKTLPHVSEPGIDAISSITEYESFLLTHAEIIYLQGLDALPVHALYLLVRLSLRSRRWYRREDFARYADDFDDPNKLEDATRWLCTSTETKQRELKEDASLLQEGSSVHTPIDLTSDSDDVEEWAAASKPGADPKALMGSLDPTCLIHNSTDHADVDVANFSFHASSEDDAALSDLLGMLSKEELAALSRKIKLSKSGTKGDIVTALLNAANTQYTLYYFQSNASGLKRSATTFGTRLRALCMDVIGFCIRINPAVISLLRRINLIFFRATAHEAHLFVPAILVASHKRKYTQYAPKRTPDIFPDRQSLLEYEASLELERMCEDALEDYKNLTSLKTQSVKCRELVESRVTDLYRQLLGRFSDSLQRQADSQRVSDRVLERFEPGHVYSRALHHIASTVGKVNGVESELAILTSLLGQDRWLCGKRGCWYDRLALLHMKDKSSTEKLRKAHELVTVALLDGNTLLRYKPKLIRRLKRLETLLELTMEERHDCFGDLKRCRDVYISGDRIRSISDDLKEKFKGTKTMWAGEEGAALGVEEFALGHYERLGFKGKHCEGGIVRFIFALLFHDILFMPIPGAFETPYQTAPLDLVVDTFYASRKDAIDARLKQILDGEAPAIAEKVDSEHRKDRTFFVGAKWETFDRQEILEILECLNSSVIHEICLQQVQDFEASGGGVPDLIVWNYRSLDARFVEVKSPSDKLSETQKLWIHFLLSAGATVEVCHVETKEDQIKRTKKGQVPRIMERNRPDGSPRAFSITTDLRDISVEWEELFYSSLEDVQHTGPFDGELSVDPTRVSLSKKRSLPLLEGERLVVEKRRKR